MRWMDRTLFYSPVTYGLCVDKKEFRKMLRKFKQDPSHPFLPTPQSNAATHFFPDPDGKQIAVVCIHPNPKGITIHQVNAMLVHEAMHIWRCIRENIGEDEPSSEFEAYVMQAISQSLMMSYERQARRHLKSKRK